MLNVRLVACLNLASQKITCFLLGKCFLSERSGGKSNYRYCRSLWGLEWDLIDRGGRAEGAGGLKGEGEPSKWAGAEIRGGGWVAGALQVNLVFSSPLLWSGEPLRSPVVSPIVLDNCEPTTIPISRYTTKLGSKSIIGLNSVVKTVDQIKEASNLLCILREKQWHY